MRRVVCAALLALACAPAARADSPIPDVAGSVVRSRRWIVRRGKKPEEEFVGDVRYHAEGADARADWALYRHWAADWRARGHVWLRRVLSGGDAVEARGETARYDQATEAGRLDPAPGGLVSFSRTPPQGGPPDLGEGRRFSWVGRESAELDGAARAWGPRVEFWADRARFDSAPSRVTLTGGRPVLRRLEGANPGAVKADVIVGYDDPRRLVATGRAVGWVVFTDTAAFKDGTR